MSDYPEMRAAIIELVRAVESLIPLATPALHRERMSRSVGETNSRQVEDIVAHANQAVERVHSLGYE